MKHLILLHFLVIGSQTLAQSLQKIELNDALSAIYLEKIFPSDNYCVHDDDSILLDFIRIHGPNFSFYENLEHDTLAIFDGKLCGGHEAGIVNVYTFVKGIPKTLISRSGKISDLQNDTLWIYTYPCCAEVINMITPFSLTTGRQLAESHVFYSRQDLHLVSPISTKRNSVYTVKKGTSLRFSPSLIDKPHAPVCGRMTNQIGVIPENSSFTLIEVTSNDWVFIRLDGMKTEEGFCFENYYTKLVEMDAYHLYAWVQVKDVIWE